MSKLLENKVAIVTGGGSGIGEATALLFAKEGAKVVVTDIDEKGGNEVVDKIKSEGGEAIFVKADSSSPEQNEEVVNKAVEEFGGLHIAVNNAGIGGAIAPVEDYEIDAWKKVIDINLSGVFYGTKYQIKAMKKSGGGSIINMASILGKAGTANSSAYVAAKHGVIGLTKSAALETSKDGVRVNAVGPGYINTPLIEEALDEEALKGLVGLHPIGRLGEANEVAEVCLFLASDKASFVTGAYFNVDGGYLAP